VRDAQSIGFVLSGFRQRGGGGALLLGLPLVRLAPTPGGSGAAHLASTCGTHHSSGTASMESVYTKMSIRPAGEVRLGGARVPNKSTP